MDRARILAIDREGDVANCSVTHYQFDPNAGRPGGLVLESYNVVAPVTDAVVPVTAAPDLPSVARG